MSLSVTTLGTEYSGRTRLTIRIRPVFDIVSVEYIVSLVRPLQILWVELRKWDEAKRAMAREARANTPEWVSEMKDAWVPRWGFVIFRTAYSDGTDAGWRNMVDIYKSTGIAHLIRCWWRADNLADKHRSVRIDNDASLDGADVGTLRKRFRTMREQGELRERVATDYFIVIGEATLRHQVVATRTFYQPKTPEHTEPWATTLLVRAIDPYHDDSVAMATEGDLAGFDGEY